MALIQTEIKLPGIWRTLAVNLFFPWDSPGENRGAAGVVTLLHGMSNTGLDWLTMTSAPRYAAENGYILVAPEADNSFYQDMAYGAPFFTALTELLPTALEQIFHIPSARDKNFVAGNSMGGFGALYFALSCPERYAAAGCFSGAVDPGIIFGFLQQAPVLRPYAQAAVGDGLSLPPGGDLLSLAQKVAQLPAAQQPRLLCTCGRQDEMPGAVYRQNMAFGPQISALPLDYTFLEWDGLHEWNFWDRSLAAFIGHIQGSDYGEQKAAGWTSPVRRDTTAGR